MSRRPVQHVTIIGVGLLGGSIGLALRRSHPRVRIAGVGRRKSSLDAALRIGAIDTVHLDATEAAAASDVVILATPIGAFEQHLRVVRGVLRRGAVVTDVGSTKRQVVRLAGRLLGADGPFVGSHPMTGGESKGPTHARADLLDGALCILTPTPRTPPAVIRRVETLWRAIGMRTCRMQPAAHDRAVARVSHLPHVLAGLLMMLPTTADLDVAGPGLRDMTRLAGGDPELWRDVIGTNRTAILAALDRFGGLLGQLRELVADGDTQGIQSFLTRAQRRRNQAFPPED